MKITLTDCEAKNIAAKLYANECGSRRRYLLHWNSGEEFMSLGIGHFIWYPAGVTKVFAEIFPMFMEFLRSCPGAPGIIDELNGSFAPFDSIEQFQSEQNGIKAENIRVFLEQTIDFQACFAVLRTEKVLERLLGGIDAGQGTAVERNFQVLAAQGAPGAYILVDYLNFKGDGLNIREHYNNQGWGLLQALLKMDDFSDIADVCKRFAAAAGFLLRERVKNSDPSRGEERWLPGWLNRINSYSA